jgi:polar amino acid transport system substrate-binding protein
MSSRLPFAAVLLLIPGCGGAGTPPAAPSPSPAASDVAPEEAPAAEAPPSAQMAPAPNAPLAAPAAPVAFYTEEQARRGQRAFRRVCSECHYTSEFKGPVFTDAWERRTARDLYRELRRTMPDDNPGGLPRQTYVDVMAYMLELNGYPAGSDELPPNEDVLRGYRLTQPEG